MAVFLFRMPAGIPGAINRASSATVDAGQLDATNYPTAFGLPVVVDATSKCIRKVLNGDASANVFGLYVRPFPTQNGASTDGLGTSTPPTSGIASVMKRGYMTVKVVYGTASKGGAVYVRTTANGNNGTVGTFDAASDSTNNFALTGAYFNGAADANGNVEIAYNL